MAEKSALLILDALSRALVEPSGAPLFASKGEPGLFPSSTGPAKAAAQRCKDEGWLTTIRNETRGKVHREVCILTETGMSYLMQQANPRRLLEDFVRVLEAREEQIDHLLNAANAMRQSMDALYGAAQQILPKLQAAETASKASPNGLAHASTSANASHLGKPPEAESAVAVATCARPTNEPPATAQSQGDSGDDAADRLAHAILERLAVWHASAGASQDCPLPTLYRRLHAEGFEPTIGGFHDCLRRLVEEDLLYLHPWTGPLYALPEPPFALLVGHEIAYYASRR
ncbi:hypothetical protein [Tuwongella immobilis]|uniref:Uncharacterized protein n=1 Tax=Tuwongella immobilis TaxID=692036 RepID=A0A6C2YQX5_9BACT|nr:hypothetical protein [Tuwongella immobilis]VIP04048.1 Uncharacterized protein OS=Candidatus Entotheonella sp. TSY2 GN=ETSY2_22115 PE=4 SV=1 [Tuwongella immobilis]VTS05463.1 Uncharacterized protein OS=Candidatus Entotheonella sp. TSY2 GN=ETSY2_22115 PE=4 SV=1 [Tuwongella immobilis]